MAEGECAVRKIAVLMVGERAPDVLERTMPVVSALAVDTQSKCRVRPGHHKNRIMHIAKISLGTTYLCKPGCHPSMCDQTLYRRHFHSS